MKYHGETFLNNQYTLSKNEGQEGKISSLWGGPQ
jgi:hypothetical protein